MSLLLWNNLFDPEEELERRLLSSAPRSLYGHLAPLHERMGTRCPVAHLWPAMHKGRGGVSTVKPEKNQFHVSLDVQHFQPEEITVKVVDRAVVVEGHHEEKQDEHGFVSRHFTRRYLIPEQCDIEQVESRLSSDGVLSITVPKKEEQPKIEGERKIQIQHTGKPAIRESAPAPVSKENGAVEAS